jgi:hypothetical protein
MHKKRAICIRFDWANMKHILISPGGWAFSSVNETSRGDERRKVGEEQP